ncbi:MAG: thiamine ABC transporter substrate-binding protein [Anaerolineae bacterium]|nr:thiamine ABC transporter substrate-binding protein [Anaerolineae bacterium]
MKRGLGCLFLTILFFVGCRSATATPPVASTEEPRELRVMAYSSFDISEAVIAQFEAEHGALVRFLDAGDTGQMISQAILSRDDPQADVIYGIDNTFLSRALHADILLPYKAKALADIPDAFKLDDQYRVSPTDYGDVCINYDVTHFRERELPLPSSLAALADPLYKGLLVVENPASSSPGLAFLLTTIAEFGEDGYLDFWRALRANDVLVVDSWDTAYYGEFSGAAGSAGTRPMVVSYATSPAAEVYFSEEALGEPPTGSITASGTCFRQLEFVGILRNARNRDLAEAFVEFVLSDTFQSDIPLHMWVFPVREAVALPEVFVAYASVAEEPATLSVGVIEQNRERWVNEWTDAVLR